MNWLQIEPCWFLLEMGHSFTLLEVGHSFTSMPDITQNYCNISTASSRGMQKSSHWKKRSLCVRDNLHERQIREILPAAERKTLETQGLSSQALWRLQRLTRGGWVPRALALLVLSPGALKGNAEFSLQSIPSTILLQSCHTWHRNCVSRWKEIKRRPSICFKFLKYTPIRRFCLRHSPLQHKNVCLCTPSPVLFLW